MITQCGGLGMIVFNKFSYNLIETNSSYTGLYERGYHFQALSGQLRTFTNAINLFGGFDNDGRLFISEWHVFGIGYNRIKSNVFIR
jgi:hypothetical protein